MRILVAPDSFKGSLSAVRFCRIAREVIQSSWPKVEVIECPLSDGGEGFIDALVNASVAIRQTVNTLDPLGRALQADYAWQSLSQTAYIEMAQASGLPLLSVQERNPLHTSTFGTGLMIQAALKQGAKKIVLGLGGSATQDGGGGALQALGFDLRDQWHQPIAPGASGLATLQHIGATPPSLKNISWQLACDVTNPLTGPQGSAYIYAEQKGASQEQLPCLDQALHHFAERIRMERGIEIDQRVGSGAAGGMAGGFIGLLEAEIKPGFEVVSDAFHLPQLFERGIDLVITGEGQIDDQTCQGKLPWRLAKLAQNYQVPTLALGGQVNITSQPLPEFLAIFSLCQHVTSLDEACEQVEPWLRQTLTHALRLYFAHQAW